MTRVATVRTGALLAILLIGCGSNPPDPAPEAAIEEPPAPPPDESRRFPVENRIEMELVGDNALGKEYLPGGNVATYERDGKTYKMFLLRTASAQEAAFLATDVRDDLTDSKFVASFGGFYGFDDDETPWFVFSKDRYLLGVVGLEQEEADLAARDFAARVE